MYYKTIDLCSGIGGIRRGFELTGRFRNVLSAEIDDQAARTYEHLFDENPRNDLTSKEFKQKVGDTHYDVLLAGFPCQAFSSAGLKLGFEDKTKGTIFFDIAEIIKRTKPKAIFLENVQNLLSHDKKRTITTILNVLEKELNYKVIGVNYAEDGSILYTPDSFKRNTKNFGLPQNRPRVYLMAFSREIYGELVDKLPNEIPMKSDRVIFSDVNSILEKEVDAHYYMSSKYLQTLVKHKARQKERGNGFGYCVVNDSGRKPQIANTIMATGGSGKERNLIYQPVEKFKGIKIPSKSSPLNTEGIRVMTPTEWGRLQGFIGYGFIDITGKDHFSFPDEVSEGNRYKQFGNSVSIPVIETMAQFMVMALDEMTSQSLYLIERFIQRNQTITRQDVMDLLKINPQQATLALRKAVEAKLLRKMCDGRNAAYEPVK